MREGGREDGVYSDDVVVKLGVAVLTVRHVL